MVLVLAYVYDMIITSSSSFIVQHVIQEMRYTFALKDLAKLHYFLGIEVIKTQNIVHLSQAKYIVDILAKHGHG